MSKTILGIATAFAIVSSIGTAQADSARYGWGFSGWRTPGIDAQQAQQRARIEQGRRSGQITRGEYERLSAEQNRIATLEARAKADGVVTRGERRVIRAEQQDASRHIYQEKHDGQSRWNRWYRRW